LQRALDNLIDNPIEFTPACDMVGLRLACDDGSVRNAVVGTGIGIRVEELPRLFRQFHRGRNAAAYPGSGVEATWSCALLACVDGVGSPGNWTVTQVPMPGALWISTCP